MPIYAGWNMGWTNDVSALPGLTGAASDYAGVRGIHYTEGSGHIWDGDSGILNERAVRIAEITDGSSNTLLLFEMAGKPTHYKVGVNQGTVTRAQFYQYGPWAGNNGIGVFNWSPDGTIKGSESAPCASCLSYINIDNESSPYSFHSGIINVMMADGSTRSLSENINTLVFVNLCRRADGNVVSGY